MNYKYNIKTYPSIILVNKDKYYIFKGSITSRSVSKWINNKINKEIHEIIDLNEIEQIFEKSDAFVVYVGDTADNSKNIIFYEEYLKSSESFPDRTFYKISNFSLIENLNIPKENKNLKPKVLIFKIFDDNLNIFSPKKETDFNSTNIESFIKAYTIPALNYFTSSNHVNNKIEFTILVVNSNKTLNLEEDVYGPAGLELYKEYYTQAIKYRGKMFFMIATYNDLSQTTINQDFDFTESDLPIILINGYNAEQTKNERYKSIPNNLDNLSEFFEKYKYRVLPRFYISEPLPTNPFVYVNVHKLVRKNFFDLVINSNENFLVYLVRRNCGLCNEVNFICIYFFKFNFLKVFLKKIVFENFYRYCKIIQT